MILQGAGRHFFVQGLRYVFRNRGNILPFNNNFGKLDVLFDENCAEHDAVDAWNQFFNSDFWSDMLNESVDFSKDYISERMAYDSGKARNTEEFIEDKCDIQELYDVSIECEVEQNGFRRIPLWKFYNRYTDVFKGYLPHHYDII